MHALLDCGYITCVSVHYEPQVNFSAVQITKTLPDLNDIFRIFRQIHVHNFLVAILLYVVAYFTGGILTILVSIWNGFIIGISVQTALMNDIKVTKLLMYLLHAPFEFVALTWFGALGLLGTENLNKIIKEEELSLNNFPKVRNYYYPAILLLIAAMIETFLFAFQI